LANRDAFLGLNPRPDEPGWKWAADTLFGPPSDLKYGMASAAACAGDTEREMLAFPDWVISRFSHKATQPENATWEDGAVFALL
jgi:hypothetical protein